MAIHVQLVLFPQQEEGNEIKTKWRFSAILGLPWRPRLAAAGGTTHVIDEVLHFKYPAQMHKESLYHAVAGSLTHVFNEVLPLQISRSNA